MKFPAFVMALVAAGGLMIQTGVAGDHCGDCCGDCGKVCKLVCTTKTITVTCYGCEYDSVCIPGPSTKGCTRCDAASDGKGCAGDCGQGPCCKFRWTEWQPGCAKVYNRKKLVKYKATKEIPSFKWVVVDGCAAEKGDTTKPATTQAKVGDELPLTAKEIQQVSAELPTKRTKPVARKKVRPADEQSAWALFAK